MSVEGGAVELVDRCMTLDFSTEILHLISDEWRKALLIYDEGCMAIIVMM